MLMITKKVLLRLKSNFNFFLFLSFENISSYYFSCQVSNQNSTFIALKIAKLFYSFPPRSIDLNLPLNHTLVYHAVSGMAIGNHNYDRITISQLFGVRDAVSHLHFLSNVSVGVSFQ